MDMDQPLCLILDQDETHSAALGDLCEQAGFRVRRVADGIPDEALTEVDIAFIDGRLGLEAMTRLAESVLVDAELFAMAETDDTGFAEACVRAGFSFFFRKPVEPATLAPMLDDIASEVSATLPGRDDADSTASMMQFGLLRGSSKGMRKLFRTLRKIAPTDTSILIVGESGTGKELVAETLHQQSRRAAQPYLTVNCAAISEHLIESELFGHEKGSFSGALKQHRGFFERADGGTLFLDEITEMAADTQAKLLRALESGEVRRVGSVEAMTFDVRIVAATNRDPHEAMETGALREDLYYRLAHVTVPVPPLRRRDRDISGLARHFLLQLNEQHDTHLALESEALEKIEAYAWPGNVRQLRHAIERAYILSEDRIGADALVLDDQPAVSTNPAEVTLPLGETLADAERLLILSNLEHFDGDKKATAAALGISLKTLYNRLRVYETDGSS